MKKTLIMLALAAVLLVGGATAALAAGGWGTPADNGNLALADELCTARAECGEDCTGDGSVCGNTGGQGSRCGVGGRGEGLGGGRGCQTGCIND